MWCRRREQSQNRHRWLVTGRPIDPGYRGQLLMISANLAAGFCAATTAAHLATIVIAAFRCRRRTAQAFFTRTVPPVSVLRAVCGIENYLTETLASSFQLNHGYYGFTLRATSRDDPGYAIVRRIIETNPE